MPAEMNARYEELSPAARRAYRLMGSLPCTEFTSDLVAVAAAIPRAQAPGAVAELSRAGLFTSGRSEGRVRFCSALGRDHAASLSKATYSDSARGAAFERMTRWLLQMAVTAQQALHPGRPGTGRYFQQPSAPMVFAHRGAAAEWLTTESDNLMATQRETFRLGRRQEVYELAEAMRDVWALPARGRGRPISNWKQVHWHGWAAAKKANEPRWQARMLEGLAAVCNHTRQPEAEEYARQALDLARDAHDDARVAAALTELGVAQLIASDIHQANRTLSQARNLYQGVGDDWGIAVANRRLGQIAADQGRHHDALGHYEFALAYVTDHGEPLLQARILTLAGRSHLRLGHAELAETRLNAALTIAQQNAADEESGHAHAALAELAEHRSDFETQCEHLQLAYLQLASVGAPQAPAIGETLAGLRRT
ncbi:tetratricopeptide repeat protein [Actinomadura viridis]|uniref:tetratricopeptide repeat protein n=1 Tax=Actinomadura viridis TaxID=58110 RepID=UPI0036ADE401